MVAAQMHTLHIRPKGISSSLRRPGLLRAENDAPRRIVAACSAQSEYRLPLFLLLQCPSERAAEEGFAKRAYSSGSFPQGECR